MLFSLFLLEKKQRVAFVVRPVSGLDKGLSFETDDVIAHTKSVPSGVSSLIVPDNTGSLVDCSEACTYQS